MIRMEWPKSLGLRTHPIVTQYCYIFQGSDLVQCNAFTKKLDKIRKKDKCNGNILDLKYLKILKTCIKHGFMFLSVKARNILNDYLYEMVSSTSKLTGSS